jgi:hypothetical protein
MNESKWLQSTNPISMLTWLSHHRSGRDPQVQRQVRLIGIAACQMQPIDPHFEPSAVEIARGLALARRLCEDEILVDDIEQYTREHFPWILSTGRRGILGAIFCLLSGPRTWSRISPTRWSIWTMLPEALGCLNKFPVNADLTAVCPIIREIFGNPFRPLDWRESWLHWQNGELSRIAQAIYQEQRFEDLPILADALQDAGCEEANILAHARQVGGASAGLLVDRCVATAKEGVSMGVRGFLPGRDL